MVDIKSYTEFSSDDDKVLREGIVGFNENIIGSRAELFAVFAKDNTNKIIGGARVYVHPQSIYIDVLWVDDDFRGKGIGSKILNEAEREGIKRHAKFSTLDTYDFQALDFYLKHGYQKMGVINDYLEGHNRIFLRKVIC